MMNPINRRKFVQNAVGTAAFAGSSIAPWVKAKSKSGKKYRTALIGSGWWGMNILSVAIEDGQCDVVALCDVDADALEISADEVDGIAGKIANTYRD